jgi:serine/threonine protein kinase
VIDLAEASEVGMAPDCKRQPTLKIVVPSLRTFYFVTESSNDRTAWVSALTKSRLAVHAGAPKTSGPAPPPVTATREKPHISIDSYGILKVLGQGTAGTVLLGRAKRDGQLYAMKMMVKKMLEKNEQVEQTLVEKEGY